MSHLFKRVMFAVLLSTSSVSSLSVFSITASAQSDSSSEPTKNEAEKKAETVIAVADFTGGDKELGRFLSETLLTQLAQSGKIALVERTEIRQALSELKLQSTGLFEPQQIKKIGKMLSADCVVVGSYLVRDEQLIVNARLLDVKTGRLISGGATSVSGNRSDLLTLTAKLARQLHQRLTGTVLNLEGTGESGSRSVKSTLAVQSEDGDRFSSLKSQGIFPAKARPGGLITERDLAQLLDQLKQHLPSSGESPLTLMSPGSPVSRMRVMTALLKLAYPSSRLSEFRNPAVGELPTDASQTPAWGLPYLALATAQGWWQQYAPFKARNVANWAFASAMLEHLPLEERHESRTNAASASEKETGDADSETFTGLLIEAAHLNPQRSMSPRILDEDGQVVYPDPKHLPDDDMLQDIGMASYYKVGQNATRAGEHPLVVKGIGCRGPIKCDIVVSRDTAEQIRRANRAGKFLWKWSVAILYGNPVEGSLGSEI